MMKIKQKRVLIPLLLALVIAGIYFSGILNFYPTISAQPSADDLFRSISLEWGEVTEDKIEIEATVTLYNKFPALEIILQRLGLSLESREYELGQVTFEEPVTIEPTSSTEVKIVLSGYLDNFQSWFVQHISNNEVSTFIVKLHLFITWRGVDLDLDVLAREITVETDLLGKISDLIIDRLSGVDH